MKANQVATLVLRLMGIYCILQTVSMIPVFGITVAAAFKNSDIFTAAMSFLLLIAPLVVGILLMGFSTLWGGKLVPPNTGEEKISAISFEQVQALGFTVAGILIFAGALPQLSNSFWFLLTLSSSPTHGNTYQIGSLVGTFLKAALGLWLFFGAHGFANFWRSMRSFGTSKPPQTP